MILMPVRALKEGMVISKGIQDDLYFKNGYLLAAGTVLTPFYINALKKWRVRAVYVERDGTGDIDCPVVVDDDLKIEKLKQIQDVFEEFTNGEKSNNVTNVLVENVTEIAKSLVSNSVNHGDIMISLGNLKSHDDYTYHHSLSVSVLSIAIGMSLGYDEERLNMLATSAMLHDIGKLKIPLDIINKPAKLTDNEFFKMKSHPVYGFETVRALNLSLPKDVLDGILLHHEKIDGTGYPYGLTGDDIPEFAKIIAVADVYDALTSNRPYRRPSLPNEAIEFIMANKGTHFDSRILKSFLQKVAPFPQGSIIKLSDDRMAIVVKNHPENCMRPTIRILNKYGVPQYDLNLLEEEITFNLTVKEVIL